jgi:hypothetical protein
MAHVDVSKFGQEEATFVKFQKDTSRELKYKSSGQGLGVDSLMQDQLDQRKRLNCNGSNKG